MKASRPQVSPEWNMLAQAEALMAAGRPADAVPLLMQAASANPESARPRCLLALAHIKQRKSKTGLRFAEEAASLSPDYEWPHRLRSILLLQLNRRREALEAAKIAAELAPEQPEALYTLANAYLENKRREEAFAAASRLLQLSPDRSTSHQMMGLIAIKESKWAEAEVHFRDAIKLDPESWENLNNLGLVLMKQGRKKEAVEFHHNAARVNPNSDLARANLFSSVSGFLGVRFLVIFLVLNSLRKVLEHSHLAQRNLISWVFVALLVAVFAIHEFWWKRRKLAELHPTVAAFYKSELRRSRVSGRDIRVVVLLTSGAMFIACGAIVWQDAVQHGANPSPLLIFGYLAGCIGIIAALIRWAFLGLRARRKAE